MQQVTLAEQLIGLEKVLNSINQNAHSREDFLTSRVNTLQAHVDELRRENIQLIQQRDQICKDNDNKVGVLWKENFQLMERLSKTYWEKYELETRYNKEKKCLYEALNEEKKCLYEALNEEQKRYYEAFNEEQECYYKAINEQGLAYYKAKKELLCEKEQLEDKLRIANRNLRDKYPENENTPNGSL